jgi:hypothetical protein
MVATRDGEQGWASAEQSRAAAMVRESERGLRQRGGKRGGGWRCVVTARWRRGWGEGHRRQGPWQPVVEMEMGDPFCLLCWKKQVLDG